ncbi:helix-turn-helix domain-containing protein [Olsenella uli]|uniref:helix-turn-helix domain-containing protein n=1 Tax=Olsenella uli TaxID=133926 RepID=UPI0016515B19|nr:helix-turn-helix domain-containing protein [Olsenella uli]
MRNETTEALCRLVTMFVAAIEREGATIPEQLVGQIATDPLKACEELNEFALTCGAVDDELDAALAAIYESMDASDARGAVDDHTRERVLRAFDEAHREPEPEPEHEPEPAEQPAEPAASAQESEQPSEPARKPHRRSRRQRGEEGPQETQPEPGQQPAAKKEAPEPKPEAQPQDRDAKAKAEPESAPAPKPVPAAASGDVLTVDQAIAVLGVSRPTVYKLIESGRLPAYKKGRSWQISAEAVAARANK